MLMPSLLVMLAVATTALWVVRHFHGRGMKLNPSCQPRPDMIAGFCITGVIHESPQCCIYQGHLPAATQLRAIKRYRSPVKFSSAGPAPRLGGTELSAEEKPTETDCVDEPSPSQRARWERTVLNQLNHPHIIKTCPTLSEEPSALDGPHLVLEYIAGKNLAQVVATRGPLPARLVARLLRQISEALEHLHLQGFYHGDISAANMMLTPTAGQRTDTIDIDLLVSSGAIKLIDLELARRLGDGENPSGRLRGTPATMAPEVATATAQDARSDLYSLGCVLYFLLTGQQPFPGRTSIEICWKQAHAAPPQLDSSSDQECLPQLADLIAQLLKKNPEERLQSASELRQLVPPEPLPPEP